MRVQKLDIIAALNVVQATTDPLNKADYSCNRFSRELWKQCKQFVDSKGRKELFSPALKLFKEEVRKMAKKMGSCIVPNYGVSDNFVVESADIIWQIKTKNFAAVADDKCVYDMRMLWLNILIDWFKADKAKSYEIEKFEG